MDQEWYTLNKGTVRLFQEYTILVYPNVMLDTLRIVSSVVILLCLYSLSSISFLIQVLFFSV